MVQENAYYPFGAPIGDLSYAAPLNNNRYGYTGQEQLNDFDLNWYDYIARNYNPLIGRFNSIDPLAEKYYSVSPYAYCNNNPVRFIDPTGEDWYEAIGKDGNGTGKYEWYKGSDERDGYRNLGSIMSFRTGNMTETYDQLELISIEEHLLDKGNFVSQLGAGGKNKPGYNCFVASKEMLSKKGITALENRSNGIETGVESGTTTSHLITATKDAQAGIAYLNSQIDDGNAVVVGVDYVHGRGINGGTTDHYITISSRIIDVRTGAFSYRYFDPGRSNSSAGTQSQNIFTINNNLLQGQGYIRNNPWYIVTHIRKNQ